MSSRILLFQGKTQLGSVPAWGGCHRISWLEERTLFALQGLALAGDRALCAEYVHPLAPGGLGQPCSGSKGGQSPCCKEPGGRGTGNSAQWVMEVTNRGICLWACFVRQEKIEISALNHTCDKSPSDVWGAGGLFHRLPTPPPPGLPLCQASVTA